MTESTTPATRSADTFSVGQVFLQEIRDPKKGKGKKKFSHFSFTLANVTLDDRHWHSITAGYGYSAKDKQYGLRLNSHGCWPDCLQEWPECSKDNRDDSASRSITITLKQGNRKTQCAYEALTSVDKKLVNTLWHSLPQLYEITKGNKKLERPNRQQAYTAWAPHVKKISNIVNSTLQNGILPTEKPAVFELNPERVAQNTVQYIARLPQPAGRSIEQIQDDFQSLLKRFPKADFRTLLLPENTNSQTVTNPALQDVLTDLAFQLK